MFGTFREAFHKQRGGRKNVTRDLGLLLELYEQWQKKVFPHDDFDTFSKKVANLYGRPGGKLTKSSTLKVCFCRMLCMMAMRDAKSYHDVVQALHLGRHATAEGVSD